MPAHDTRSCIAAVVSAFNGAAELVQSLRERDDKKLRRTEEDMEKVHRALVDSAVECRSKSEEKLRSHGPTFSVGDLISTSEMKDVMMSIQIKVVSMLQMVKGDLTMELDAPTILDAVYTQKNLALKSMEDLCHRIAINMARPPAFTPPHFQHAPHLAHRRVSSQPVEPPFQADENTFARRRAEQSAPSNAVVRDTQTEPTTGSPYIRHAGVANYNSSPSASLPDVTHHERRDDHNRDVESAGQGFQAASKLEQQMDELSLHDSARVIEAARQTPDTMQSTAGVASVGDRPDSPGFGVTYLPRNESDHGIVNRMEKRSRSYASSSDQHVRGTPSISSTSSVPSNAMSSTLQSPDPYDVAPEVVTKEYASMLGPQNSPRRAHISLPASPSRRELPSLQHIHPALRDEAQYYSPADFDYVHSPVADSADVWLPLTRPAKHNNYHGYCKGAWQSRKALQEGFAVCVVPNSNGTNLRHWRCKHCKFQSKPVSTDAHLPNEVYFDKTGVRYKWLLLAKSHVPAEKVQQRPEQYRYGCIFCAAEGRPISDVSTILLHRARASVDSSTSLSPSHSSAGSSISQDNASVGAAGKAYASLSDLMGHIVAKHRTSMMTPEVLEKTRCVIGGAPDRRQEWDVNMQPTERRKVSGKVGDFVMSAVTGMHR